MLLTDDEDITTDDDETATAAFCLLIPGKTLYLSHLLALKKFRNKGIKDGALKALCMLEKEELGRLLLVEGSGGPCAVSCVCVGWLDCPEGHMTVLEGTVYQGHPDMP